MRILKLIETVLMPSQLNDVLRSYKNQMKWRQNGIASTHRKHCLAIDWNCNRTWEYFLSGPNAVSMATAADHRHVLSALCFVWTYYCYCLVASMYRRRRTFSINGHCCHSNSIVGCVTVVTLMLNANCWCCWWRCCCCCCFAFVVVVNAIVVLPSSMVQIHCTRSV